MSDPTTAETPTLTDNIYERLGRLLAGKYYDRALSHSLKHTSMDRETFVAEKWIVFHQDVADILNETQD